MYPPPSKNRFFLQKRFFKGKPKTVHTFSRKCNSDLFWFDVFFPNAYRLQFLFSRYFKYVWTFHIEIWAWASPASFGSLEAGPPPQAQTQAKAACLTTATLLSVLTFWCQVPQSAFLNYSKNTSSQGTYFFCILIPIFWIDVWGFKTYVFPIYFLILPVRPCKPPARHKSKALGLPGHS